MNFEFRKYQSIAAYTTSAFDYVPANGASIYASEVGGDTSNEAYVIVSVTWDAGGIGEEIIFATYLSSVQSTEKVFVGDGVKKLRITLDNQTSASKIMGAYILGLTDG